MINGIALNRAGLNARPRLRVSGAGGAPFAIGALLDGTRRPTGRGDVVLGIASSGAASAIRAAAGDFVLPVSASLMGSATRNAVGDAMLGVHASLFYQRTIYASADAALIELTLRGDVGIVFIDGEGVMHPLSIEIDASREHTAAGAAVIGVTADFTASATRRGSGSSASVIAFDGDLDPSHISGGVRYVGGSGRAVHSVVLEDAGFKRQVNIGALDFGLVASGTAVVMRPTLAGQCIKRIEMSADFHVIRRAQGALLLERDANLSGEIFVRGDGQAVISVGAVGTGYVYRRTISGAAVKALSVALDGVRGRTGFSEITPVVLEAVMDGTRVVVADADAPIEVLSFSFGVIDPFAEDISDQRYSSPARARAFVRPMPQREWRKQ